ncbi:MAG: HAMP domain-containing protein [Balneolaceae bacterium]|nr:HAMP domain-containing protein [Balneolaceae bacterium]MBO6545841.1 HAMP domain-containing protein [Balneolaceae bacterium]MBO6647237.1 HAMP domain-containing protein [Balneolaceae bacterium]
MNIQAKLAFVYITLLSIGVVVISSYAILSIRSFLLDEAIQKFENDARTFAQSFEETTTNEELLKKTSFVSELTGYNVALFDSIGNVLVSTPFQDSELANSREFLNDALQNQLDGSENQVIINEEALDKLISFRRIGDNGSDAQYLRISQYKNDLYAAEASIRHLIYGAMIGSILVVVIVSFFFARYLARPIKQLNEAALEIADGNLDKELNVNRNDEFGMLAESLNKMAGTLKADNDQLKKLNEKQNQFFADITHEVRNPLHTISGALEMIQVPNLDNEKKSQYMATAQKQVERVVRLFEDIKSLQRYDYDESFIRKSEFEIGILLQEVVGTYTPIAAEKELTFQLDIESKVFVKADRDKIEQVLDNLISNAVKYTNEGNILVGCVSKSSEAEISISDSGIGIGKVHLERLFDRFYRTDKARSRDKGGTGLGLSVVKGILSAHKKDIYVESEVEKGSRFYFYLDVVTR